MWVALASLVKEEGTSNFTARFAQPLFVFNSQKRTYEPLGVAEFNNVVAGKARL